MLEPPLHPVRHRTTADAAAIMIPREPARSASKQPAGLPVLGIKLFPAAVTGAGVLPVGCACITTFFGPIAEASSRAVGDHMETAWRPRGGSLPLHGETSSTGALRLPGDHRKYPPVCPDVCYVTFARLVLAGKTSL